MIEVSAPLRISFFGGGSDLPAYYRSRPGAVVSATIDRAVHVRMRAFDGGVRLVLDGVAQERQTCEALDDRLVRAVLRRRGIARGVELEIWNDASSGVGLGSSSSLTVALLHAAAAWLGANPSACELAVEACQVEMLDLDGALGKQDQYAAAYGGINVFEFFADERVEVRPLTVDARALANHLLLFSSGIRRYAQPLLLEHAQRLSAGTALAAQARLVELTHAGVDCLVAGRWADFCRLLDDAWQLKRSLSPRISNPAIDSLYGRALRAGALGGKLLGAGGGGILLVGCEPEHRSRIRQALADVRELAFELRAQGSRIDSAESAAPRSTRTGPQPSIGINPQPVMESEQ